MQKTVLYVTAEMLIPELGWASRVNQRGGLGDLAGHTLEGFVKNGIRVIPITYFYPQDWQTGKVVDYHLTPAHYRFNLDVDIYWQRRTVPVFCIDRAGAEVFGINDPEAGVLYPEGWKKLRQAAFLGRAAHALLKRPEIVPDIAWCQEWICMPVMPNLKDDPCFQKTRFLFTLHTSVREALDTFPVEEYPALALDERHLSAFLRDRVLDPTLAGIRLANLVTGVSQEHGLVCGHMFPEYSEKIQGIMNGTSKNYLLSPHIRTLLEINPFTLWAAHQADKQELIAAVEKETGIALDPEEPIMGLYRREVSFKNRLPMFAPNLHALCAPRGKRLNGKRGLGLNVIFGGVAHENDPYGRGATDQYQRWMKEPALRGKFVYLPHYNASWRSLVVRGCDIHVECPIPRMEACGTSTMLAKINGVPSIATRGGGHKEHGRDFDPETEEGDTLFIDPYTSDTLYLQAQKACDWYYDWKERGNPLWLRLKMNNFLRGDEVDIARMVQQYDERCFEPLLKAQNSA